MDRRPSEFPFTNIRAGPPPARLLNLLSSRVNEANGCNPSTPRRPSFMPPTLRSRPNLQSSINLPQGIPEESSSSGIYGRHNLKRTFVEDTPVPRLPPNNQHSWRQQSGYIPPQPPPRKESWFNETNHPEIMMPRTSQHDAFFNAANGEPMPPTRDHFKVPYHRNQPLDYFKRHSYDSSDPQLDANFNEAPCHPPPCNNNNSNSWRPAPPSLPRPHYSLHPGYNRYDGRVSGPPHVAGNTDPSSQSSSLFRGPTAANFPTSNQSHISSAQQYEIRWTRYEPMISMASVHDPTDHRFDSFAAIRNENNLQRYTNRESAPSYTGGDTPRINTRFNPKMMNQQPYIGSYDYSMAPSNAVGAKVHYREVNKYNQRPPEKELYQNALGSCTVDEKSVLGAKDTRDQLDRSELGEINMNLSGSADDKFGVLNTEDSNDRLCDKTPSGVSVSTPLSPAVSAHSCVTRASKHGELRIPVPRPNFITVASRVVWLIGLPADCNQQELKQIISVHGCVNKVNVCGKQSSALVTMSTREEAANVVHNIGREFYIREKRVKVYYGKGKGVSKHSNHDHWDGTRGITYLPFECLPIDLSGLIKESYLDIESLPSAKRNYYNSDGTFKTSSVASSSTEFRYDPSPVKCEDGSVTSNALQQRAVMYNYERQLNGYVSSEDEAFICVP